MPKAKRYLVTEAGYGGYSIIDRENPRLIVTLTWAQLQRWLDDHHMSAEGYGVVAKG